jgi:hypothetical protein
MQSKSDPNASLSCAIVDRDAHARAARRRQAEDALAFERDREAMLTLELQDLLADANGAEIDAAVFAAMAPEDAELVQAALGSSAGANAWEEDDGDAEPDEPDVVDEEELVRLQGEIESSRRSQAALKRYLEVLGSNDHNPTG